MARGNIAYDQIRDAHRQGIGAKFQMFGTPEAPPVAGQVATYDASGNLIPSTLTAGGGSGMAGYGRFVDLPTVCNPGETFFTSDSQHFFVCAVPNLWKAYFQGREVVLPPSAGWTSSPNWDAGSTIDSSLGYQRINLASKANLQVRYRPAPASTGYQVIAGLRVNSRNLSTGAGVFFRDSAGKFIRFSVGLNGSTFELVIQKWSSDTAWVANYVETTGLGVSRYANPGIIYLWMDDGVSTSGSLTWKISIDRINWQTLDTRTRGDYLNGGTYDIGFGGNADGGVIGISLIDWDVTQPGAASWPRPGDDLLLASFEGSAQYLNLFSSADGASWVLGPNRVYPPTGLVRDPSIFKHTDGKWYVCHTHYQPSPPLTQFDISSSSDLWSWSAAQAVSTAGLSGVQHTWAPEWYVDPNDTGLSAVHVFVSLSTQSSPGNFQIYEMHPTAADFSTWSAPQLVTITGETNVIDPFLIYKDGYYYLWYKNESSKYICYARSATLLGTYTPIKTGDWAGWGSYMEGPCIIDMGGTPKQWRLYFDAYQNSLTLGQIYYSDSVDDWATWSVKQPISTIIQAKQGTVIAYP